MSKAVDGIEKVEILIVGAGPAGLSAALVLGRCRRRVLVCDTNQPRNAAAAEVHGYLGVQGASPSELREIGRRQISAHPNVQLREIEVMDLVRSDQGFVARLRGGTEVRAQKVLLASGVDDEVPSLPGLSPLWGRVVFPCPYCDGWEFQGQKLGALAIGCDGSALTRALTTWSADVALFTTERLEPSMERAFDARGVKIYRQRVLAVEAHEAGLSLILEGAEPVHRGALFVAGPQKQQSSRLARLGCSFTDSGLVECGTHQSTGVPGLFVAGDAAANIQFAIIAAAEGATAAFAINRELLREDFDV